MRAVENCRGSPMNAKKIAESDETETDGAETPEGVAGDEPEVGELLFPAISNRSFCPLRLSDPEAID